MKMTVIVSGVRILFTVVLLWANHYFSRDDFPGQAAHSLLYLLFAWTIILWIAEPYFEKKEQE